MRVLRGLVISMGLGVLGLFGLVELIVRRRSGSPPAPQADDRDDQDVDLFTNASRSPVSRPLLRARLSLDVVGVALLVYGVYLVVRTVPWTSYLAIAVWLAAGVVLHDAVLAPAVSVLREATVRGGRRLSAASLALIEGAFVVGGVVSLVAVPAIWAQHLGPLNPTVLPGSYGRSLLLTWLVLVVVTASSVAVIQVLARRRASQRLALAG